jgi:hypothetical protein
MPVVFVSHSARSGCPLTAPLFHRDAFSTLIAALMIGTSAD